MIEIKLRAWNKETALMGQCCTLNEILYFAHRNPSRESDLPLLIWMQYTGLKDKNGVEIFEGDMLKIWDPVYEEDSIVVVECTPSLYVYFPSKNKELLSWGRLSTLPGEVIGNIYEYELTSG